jgi:hypothetical protein
MNDNEQQEHKLNKDTLTTAKHPQSSLYVLCFLLLSTKLHLSFLLQQLRPSIAHRASATLPISSLLASAFTSGAAADGGVQMAGRGPDSSSRHAFTAASFTSTLLALHIKKDSFQTQVSVTWLS